MFETVFLVSQVLNPGVIRPVLCADNSLKAYKPHAKESGKEGDIGEGGKRSSPPLFTGGYLKKIVHSWTDIHCLKFKTNQV